MPATRKERTVRPSSLESHPLRRSLPTSTRVDCPKRGRGYDVVRGWYNPDIQRANVNAITLARNEKGPTCLCIVRREMARSTTGSKRVPNAVESLSRLHPGRTAATPRGTGSSGSSRRPTNPKRRCGPIPFEAGRYRCSSRRAVPESAPGPRHRRSNMSFLCVSGTCSRPGRSPGRCFHAPRRSVVTFHVAQRRREADGCERELRYRPGRPNRPLETR